MWRLNKIENFLLLLESCGDEGLRMIYRPHKSLRRGRKGQGNLGRAIQQARRQAYLELVEKKGQEYLSFTTKGKLKLLGLISWRQKRKLWDGRWRIVVFDIEEKK